MRSGQQRSAGSPAGPRSSLRLRTLSRRGLDVGGPRRSSVGKINQKSKRVNGMQLVDSEISQPSLIVSGTRQPPEGFNEDVQ